MIRLITCDKTYGGSAEAGIVTIQLQNLAKITQTIKKELTFNSQ
jgi:hypothetical protein